MTLAIKLERATRTAPPSHFSGGHTGRGPIQPMEKQKPKPSRWKRLFVGMW